MDSTAVDIATEHAIALLNFLTSGTDQAKDIIQFINQDLHKDMATTREINLVDILWEIKEETWRDG
jgi:uncharacterized tellurite resistance protein B-like protein